MIGRDWINRARLYLLAGQVEERNKLAVDYSSGSGTLTFSMPMKSIQAGVRLSCGLNTFYVWEVHNQTATVTGGEDGGADTPLSSGDIVRVRPRWSDYEIWTAIIEDLAELSAPTNGLFQMKTTTFNYSQAIDGYDLAGVTNILAIDSLRMDDGAHSKLWTTMGPGRWQLLRDADPTDFPSGLGLVLYDPPLNGAAVRVTYRAPFDPPYLEDPQYDVTSTGLPATANDLPPMGAVVRLVASREIRRNQTETQPETRRATEVGPGAIAASYRGIAALRATRIFQEAARLKAAYPIIKDN